MFNVHNLRVVTPRSILANPLLTWREPPVPNMSPQLVPNTPETQILHIPWSSPVRTTVNVREEAGDKLVLYSESKWKEVTDDEEIDDESLDKCVKHLFTVFMWKRLQSKLSKQVLARMCQDKAKLTTDDIIMNLAIQIDSLTAWQNEVFTNITVVNGYDKLVWYSGVGDNISKIAKVTPDKLYKIAKSTITHQFRKNLINSISERYLQKYEEITIDKSCKADCRVDGYNMVAYCPFTNEHCQDVPGYCCHSLSEFYSFGMWYSEDYQKSKFVRMREGSQPNVLQFDPLFNCLDFYETLVDVSEELLDSYQTITDGILFSPTWQWILALSPHQIICLFHNSTKHDIHHMDISLHLQDLNIQARLSLLNTSKYQKDGGQEFPSFWLFNCSSQILSREIQQLVSRTIITTLDLMENCGKWDRGEDYLLSQDEQFSLLVKKLTTQPVDKDFYNWANCGNSIIGKVGPVTWATNNRILMFVNTLRIDYTQFFQKLNSSNIYSMDVWARSADDLVCRFQRFHSMEMVEEPLYSAPVYWVLGYNSSFILVFIIIPSAKVYLLIRSLKSMEFFKYHLRLSRSR